MKNNRNIFWGFFFILCAVFVLMRQMGFYPEISLIRLLLTVCFAAAIINGVKHCNFFSILVPLACLYIMYNDFLDEFMGLDSVSPFSVLCAAIFAAIGLGMIFPNKNRIDSSGSFSKNGHPGQSRAAGGEDTVPGDDSYVAFKSLFGSGIKYVNSSAFNRADLECTFGTLTVYFDNAIIQGNQAFVHVDVTFGTLVLYIPSTWQVEDNIDSVFAGVKLQNPLGNPIGPQLVISGDAVFSTVTVKYI